MVQGRDRAFKVRVNERKTKLWNLAPFGSQHLSLFLLLFPFLQERRAGLQAFPLCWASSSRHKERSRHPTCFTEVFHWREAKVGEGPMVYHVKVMLEFLLETHT